MTEDSVTRAFIKLGLMLKLALSPMLIYYTFSLAIACFLFFVVFFAISFVVVVL